MLIGGAAPFPRRSPFEFREPRQEAQKALYLPPPATRRRTEPRLPRPPLRWQKSRREHLSAFAQWKGGSRDPGAAWRLLARPIRAAWFSRQSCPADALRRPPPR